MKRIAMISTVAMVMATAWTGEAKPTAYLEELNNRSRAQGLDRRTVPLLARSVGPGSASRTQDVLSMFESSKGAVLTRDIRRYEAAGDYVRAEGENWFVQVRGNGDWIRYRRTDYLHSEKNPHRSVRDAPAEDRLVAVARSFVEGELAAYVPLCEHEEVVHFRTVREFFSSEHRITRERVESVVSTAIVFTRKINGVDVVGSGSKVMVMLANDETVVGFDVDWSQFEDVGVMERTLDLPEIESRSYAASLVAKDGGRNQLLRFECGYYDVGSPRADPSAFLQPACISHVLMKSSYASGSSVMNSEDGFIEVTPAGELPERDSAWPEIAAFSG